MTDMMKKDFKIVEKFKWFILVSLAIIVAGVVCVCMGRFNLGIDYTGGAKISVELGGFAKGHENEFEDTYKKFLEGKGFKVLDRMQISESEGSQEYEFRIEYSLNGKKIDKNNEKEQLMFQQALTGDDNDASDKGVQGDLQQDLIKDGGFIKTYNDGNVDDYQHAEDFIKAYVVGASASSSLVTAAIWAIVVAIVVMLVYIMIRFTVSGAFAAIFALLHDVLIMTSLTAIFNIPVNSTFIAAVITIIGYSINSTIVIFDKIRECIKSPAFELASDAEIANYSIKHSLVKIFLSSLTTMIMILVLLFFSVSTIQEFILPIVFGLIAGFWSAVLLSSSVWVFNRKLGKKMKLGKKNKAAGAKKA